MSIVDVLLCLCLWSLQVDVKVVKEAKGRVYYFEHLPLLGETKVPRRGSVAVGDYVRIGMPLDAVRRNQTGHGGWCEAMMEVGGSGCGAMMEVGGSGCGAMMEVGGSGCGAILQT